MEPSKALQKSYTRTSKASKRPDCLSSHFTLKLNSAVYSKLGADPNLVWNERFGIPKNVQFKKDFFNVSFQSFGLLISL